MDGSLDDQNDDNNDHLVDGDSVVVRHYRMDDQAIDESIDNDNDHGVDPLVVCSGDRADGTSAGRTRSVSSRATTASWVRSPIYPLLYNADTVPRNRLRITCGAGPAITFQEQKKPPAGARRLEAIWAGRLRIGGACAGDPVRSGHVPASSTGH